MKTTEKVKQKFDRAASSLFEHFAVNYDEVTEYKNTAYTQVIPEDDSCDEIIIEMSIKKVVHKGISPELLSNG